MTGYSASGREEPDSAGHGAIEDMIRALIASELDAIRDALDDLGTDLCMHPVIIEHFTHTLQSLDELAQRNENLARLLRSDVMAPAIPRITLESLRSRLLTGMDCPPSGLAKAG